MMQTVVIIPVQEPQTLIEAEQGRLGDQQRLHPPNVSIVRKPPQPGSCLPAEALAKADPTAR